MYTYIHPVDVIIIIIIVIIVGVVMVIVAVVVVIVIVFVVNLLHPHSLFSSLSLMYARGTRSLT